MSRRLVIEIKYGGLGDHLFHSPLPRIAKETGAYQEVFISSKSLFRHPNYKKLVWEYNPYIDGFIDDSGVSIDIQSLVIKVNKTSQNNLIDEIMLSYGLDNEKRWNQPEVHYVPKFIPEFHKIIYDPNYLSWIGTVTKDDAMKFFKRNNLNFDAVMKLRSDKVLFIPSENTQFIETPTLEDFCDLIYSSKKLYCLTSGTATLASALKKQATVFYGKGQPNGFQHDNLHEYIFMPHYFVKRAQQKIIKLFKIWQN